MLFFLQIRRPPRRHPQRHRTHPASAPICPAPIPPRRHPQHPLPGAPPCAARLFRVPRSQPSALSAPWMRRLLRFSSISAQIPVPPAFFRSVRGIPAGLCPLHQASLGGSAGFVVRRGGVIEFPDLPGKAEGGIRAAAVAFPLIQIVFAGKQRLIRPRIALARRRADGGIHRSLESFFANLPYHKMAGTSSLVSEAPEVYEIYRRCF